MAFWAVEVKPDEPYVLEPSSRGRLRITQATLDNLENVGWSTVTCSVSGKRPVRFCTLSSTLVMYKLDLEYEEGQNVVFSVIGDSSVHLAGYYKIPDASANVQALVPQIQEADDRETTRVHGTIQEHNALGTEVHNDGTNQMVGHAGLNAAADVQALVTQSQESNDPETADAHDIARGCNALETGVHNDCTKQMVGQAGRTPKGKGGLNIMISDEGSGHCPVYKDVGGPNDKVKIVELEVGDCNAGVASHGKKVKVKYIGKLQDGEVVDHFKGGPAIHEFRLGVDKVIAGWHQGIQGMRVGGKRILTIPPALGYMDEPQLCKRKNKNKPPKVMLPANSWLVYDIELLEVSEPAEVPEPAEEKPKKKSRSVNPH